MGVTIESQFAIWVHNNKKALTLVGVFVVIATYVSKELVQSHFEAKVRAIENLRSEIRLTERIQRIEPNLRDELSRGIDSRRKQQDPDATLFLHSGEYPPGYGKPDVPFYFAVDMECEDDIQCRVAEWYRRRATIEDNLQRNELLLETIGGPSWFDDFDLLTIRQSKEKVDQKKAADQQAFADITKKGADGNLRPLTRDGVDGFASAVSALDSATEEQAFSILMYAAKAIERTKRNLQIATIASGILFFLGWIMTQLEKIYSAPVNSSPATGDTPPK